MWAALQCLHKTDTLVDLDSQINRSPFASLKTLWKLAGENSDSIPKKMCREMVSVSFRNQEKTSVCQAGQEETFRV